uniref:Secreted protein n=1 Tax=Heterorhabditis bacteriophora TaxID=37862 RepID=A0A1I7WJX6_HETBA
MFIDYKWLFLNVHAIYIDFALLMVRVITSIVLSWDQHSRHLCGSKSLIMIMALMLQHVGIFKFSLIEEDICRFSCVLIGINYISASFTRTRPSSRDASRLLLASSSQVDN